jgi:hypothetical protein
MVDPTPTMMMVRFGVTDMMFKILWGDTSQIELEIPFHERDAYLYDTCTTQHSLECPVMVHTGDYRDLELLRLRIRVAKTLEVIYSAIAAPRLGMSPRPRRLAHKRVEVYSSTPVTLCE